MLKQKNILEQEIAGASHESFTLQSSHYIRALNTQLHVYVHKGTGCRHYHFHNNARENVFLVAVKTPPTNSSGVFHVLEHLVLCGSRNYPVHDVFALLSKGSLSTYLNAFTGPDLTVFPFATCNYKDFCNLRSVLLDCVFFPNLLELDFLKEACRLTGKYDETGKLQLAYTGVVYNEMKGALGSPNRAMWQLIKRRLFPSTSFRFNSGGVPEQIALLTHEQVIAAHRLHYHPGNAIVMSYGDIPAVEHQLVLHEAVLSKCNKPTGEIRLADEERFSYPKRFNDCYPVPESEASLGNNAKVGKDNASSTIIAWMLGRAASAYDLACAQLLSNVLMGGSASPLTHAIEQSNLGIMSSLSGIVDSNREIVLMCGVEKSNKGKAQEFEDLVVSVLTDIADSGIAPEQIEAGIHQLELKNHRTDNDSIPYGLQLMLKSLPGALHQGDITALLDMGSVIAKIRERNKNPSWFSNLVKTTLLHNTHRVTSSLSPGTGLYLRKEKALEKKIEGIQAAITPQQKVRLLKIETQISNRRTSPEQARSVPGLCLADLDSPLPCPESSTYRLRNLNLIHYSQGFDRVVYHQVSAAIPKLQTAQYKLLRIFAMCLTQLGIADKSYRDVQSLQNRMSGGLSGQVLVRADNFTGRQCAAVVLLHGCALMENADSFFRLMQDTMLRVSFREKRRVYQLLQKEVLRQSKLIPYNGGKLAMSLASSVLNPAAALQETLHGVHGIKNLQTLVKRISDETGLEELCSELYAIKKRLNKEAVNLAFSSDSKSKHNLKNLLGRVWDDSWDPKTKRAHIDIPPYAARNYHWHCAADLGHFAQAYAAVPVTHEDAPVFEIIARLLSAYLFREIREKGCSYGAGAVYQPNLSVLQCYSYRDPDLARTINVFANAVDWLVAHNHKQKEIESAIIESIGVIDKPISPPGEAREEFIHYLFDSKRKDRELFRQRLISVTRSDIRRVAEKYFNVTPGLGLIGGHSAVESLQNKLDFYVV